MADYALFLKCNFNPHGNFVENTFQRDPDNRFWQQVDTSPAGVITPTPGTNRINADTRTVEMVARSIPPVGPAFTPTDKVYFAVLFVPPGPTPLPSSISFMCSINPIVRINKATKASPFRLGSPSPSGVVQSNLTSSRFSDIVVSADTYKAIGPYELVKDPGAASRDCCFHKLTVVVSATNGGVTREFAYDPDMDIESGL